MTAAGRRDVGEHAAAGALEQLAELGRLVLDLGGRVGTVAGPGTHRKNMQKPGQPGPGFAFYRGTPVSAAGMTPVSPRAWPHR